jgi:hypothetical protein
MKTRTVKWPVTVISGVRLAGVRLAGVRLAIVGLAIAGLTGIVLAGCQSATSTNNPAPPNRTNFKYGKGNGQTMASAVQIRTRSETDGGVLIRNWIKANYPGYTIQEQELIEARDKAYNLITIIGPSNTAQRLYFDISTYYRRLGNDDFPKPLS